MSDVKQFAIELLATAKGRHPKEPVMILAERARAIAEAIISGNLPEAESKPKLDDMPSRVVVKQPKEEALRLLEAGPLKLNDLQIALGHASRAPTLSLVKGLVKAKKVSFDEKTTDVKLVAGKEAA